MHKLALLVLGQVKAFDVMLTSCHVLQDETLSQDDMLHSEFQYLITSEQSVPGCVFLVGFPVRRTSGS
jgi:hypothetical protein